MLFVPTTSDAQLTDSNLFRFIPMMISRMVISLKKAAGERQPHLGLEVPSVVPINLQDVQYLRGVDGIQLPIPKAKQV